jgi:hypothetical protein
MFTVLACVQALALRGGRARSMPGIMYTGSRLLLSTEGDNDNNNNNTGTNNKEWRRRQLDALEKRFATSEDLEDKIQDDDGLQGMWKSMESRVRNRRSMTLAQTKGMSGRANVRKTEEDVWLQEGLYDNDNDNDNDKATK